MNYLKNRYFSIVLFVALGVIWEILSRNELINSHFLPPPTQILKAFIEWLRSGEFQVDLVASIWRCLSGLLIGCIVGVILGLLTGRNKVINQLLSPLLNLFRSFPPVALLPVFITLLGIGDVSKILSIAFACLFPVWVNTHIGSSNIPEEYLRSATLMTTSKFKIFSRVIFPSAMSWIIGGIRLAIAMSFIMLYVSELAGASNGLGYQIASSHLSYRIDRMFASLFFLGFLASMTDVCFQYSINYFFPWLKYLRTS